MRNALTVVVILKNIFKLTSNVCAQKTSPEVRLPRNPSRGPECDLCFRALARDKAKSPPAGEPEPGASHTMGHGVLRAMKQDQGEAFSGIMNRMGEGRGGGGHKVCLGAAKGRDVTWGQENWLLQTQRERGSPEGRPGPHFQGLGRGWAGSTSSDCCAAGVQ